jgi:hypothetical protein
MASGPSTPWRHQTSKWFVGVAQKAHIRSTVQVILSDTETTSRGVLCLAPIGRLACMTTRLSRSCCSALRSIRRSKNVSERCIKKLPTRTAASFDTMRLGQSDPSRPATRLPVARGLALFLHTFCLRNLSIGFRGPFRGLCLCRPKSRFPRAEIGVGGDLVRMRSSLDQGQKSRRARREARGRRTLAVISNQAGGRD